jgi:hypothetical protein
MSVQKTKPIKPTGEAGLTIPGRTLLPEGAFRTGTIKVDQTKSNQKKWFVICDG